MICTKNHYPRKAHWLYAIVITVAYLFLLVAPEGTNLTASFTKAKKTHNIESVNLSCTILNSIPLPSSYRFYHNNKLVQETSSNTYSIDPVSVADEGTYTCGPVNLAGNGANASLFLKVVEQGTLLPYGLFCFGFLLLPV